MNASVIAADLGGTNLRMAVVDPDGTLSHRIKRSTRSDAGADIIVAEIVSAARECLEASGGTASGFGIAAPATIDFARGILKSSPNLPSLNGLKITEVLSDQLGIKTILDNDGTAAAVGEHWLGATKGTQNSICVTLGTGVGGGLIFDGKPYRGTDGTAGEIGHIGVVRGGHPCGCGSRGCVEQYSSATAVVRIAKELAEGDPHSLLASKANITAADVYAAGMASDKVALEVFSIVGSYLGMALADLVNLLNPEVIVIAGGVAGAWDLFADQMRREIDDRAFPEPAERVKLVRAQLGDDAGILGAARLAFTAIS